MKDINIDGLRFPVTDQWFTDNISLYPELGELTFEDLERERDRLLLKSENRLPQIGKVVELFTGTDQIRLNMVTRILNAHRATRWLQGRPLSDFGFTGVDQVHGNSASCECGCILQYCFDHNLAMAEKEVTLYPHVPIKICVTHLSLTPKDPFDKTQLAALHKAVMG